MAKSIDHSWLSPLVRRTLEMLPTTGPDKAREAGTQGTARLGGRMRYRFTTGAALLGALHSA